MSGSCSGVHSATASRSPRARCGRRNAATPVVLPSLLPTSISSTRLPRCRTARLRDASRITWRQRSCHIPYPHMPATSRAPLVAQNGVAPRFTADRQRTSSRIAAVLPTPAGPTSNTLRGWRAVSSSASRSTSGSRPKVASGGSRVRSTAVCLRTDGAFCCSRSAARARCLGLRISTGAISRSTRSRPTRCRSTSPCSVLAWPPRDRAARISRGRRLSRSSGFAAITSIPSAGTKASSASVA